MSTITKVEKEHMDVVIVGHVDHGKSTVIGRLMADTGSLPEGKLEQVKAMCARNARPFEYAFLLDALKNEQAQGITIDTARCFFKTARRHYIINDAPGHIEFLKNMVTGAARAEAALLVIDAHEGVQENSKRHGYMVSMLGLKQLAVLVNKMDLVDYSEARFESIKAEYLAFLEQLGVHPAAFIPVSAREGVNIAASSEKEMPWYDGKTVLEQVDAFNKIRGDETRPFRMPVQDIYKFTAAGDDRRIVAGTVLTGIVRAGDPVRFLPSGKESTVKTVEAFNATERTEAVAGYATGLTLTTQIYIKPGELMVRADEPQPRVSRRFRVNMFWMGRPPMVKGKPYKLKVGSAAVSAELAEIIQVLDASELTSVQNKQQVERHDVAECILETVRPIAFDLRNEIEATGRVVIVDDFEIAGAGVILEALDESGSVMAEHIRAREFSWERGPVTQEERSARFHNVGKLIILHGVYGCGKRRVAKQLERRLFDRGHKTYYFGISNYFEELDHDVRTRDRGREEHLERLGDLARVITDEGTLLITTVTDADDYDLERLKLMTSPNEIFVVNLGENPFDNYPIDVALPYRPDMDEALDTIIGKLRDNGVLHK
ncbi:MAG: adenylyl-sulfate kinase [Candidatus Hydrogenedentes bacterium]|nr:adenylyl-sulfate kinase [Candidatus Hydrogenedentota bacterium]